MARFEFADEAAQAARQEPHCQAVGGFVVACLARGEYDWYPTGHPIPAGATVVERWYHGSGDRRWRCVERFEEELA